MPITYSNTAVAEGDFVKRYKWVVSIVAFLNWKLEIKDNPGMQGQ
jgi:hypothetical protein